MVTATEKAVVVFLMVVVFVCGAALAWSGDRSWLVFVVAVLLGGLAGLAVYRRSR